MKQLAEYLARATTFLSASRGNRSMVIDTCKELGIPLEDSKTFFKNGVLKYRGSPLIKSALYLKRESIITAVNKKLPNTLRSIE